MTYLNTKEELERFFAGDLAYYKGKGRSTAHACGRTHLCYEQMASSLNTVTKILRKTNQLPV